MYRSSIETVWKLNVCNLTLQILFVKAERNWAFETCTMHIMCMRFLHPRCFHNVPSYLGQESQDLFFQKTPDYLADSQGRKPNNTPEGVLPKEFCSPKELYVPKGQL